MLDFPQQSRQDSKYYTEQQEDQTMRTEMEGGYVYSRPRHTRAPRMTYTTGFTHIDNEAKIEIKAFIDTVKGGSDAFNWIVPTSFIEDEQVTKVVRLKSPPTYKYVGLNGVHLWDIENIELEEV